MNRSGVHRRRRAATTVSAALLREAQEDRILGLAAEIAFFAVLSLFPGLLIAASLLGFLDLIVGPDIATDIQTKVAETLRLILTDRAAGTVEAVEDVFEGEYGGLLTFATIGALVSLSGAWAVVIASLNQAFDVTEQRSWLRRRLLGLVLAVSTLVVVVLTLTVVVIGPLLGRGDEVADLVGLGSAFTWAWSMLRLPLLFVAVTGWLTVVLHRAPNVPTSWRSAVPGAVTTAALWLLATAGFHLYLRLMGDRNPVLGAFGGGVIVMTWVYLLSLALLVGGELNGLLDKRRREAEGALVRDSREDTSLQEEGSEAVGEHRDDDRVDRETDLGRP